MAVTTKVLVPAAYANSASPGMYTATGVTTIIDKFTARCWNTGSVTLDVHLVENSGAASDSNLILSRVLKANETYIFPEMVGQCLLPGGKIVVVPSTNSAVSVRVCGREIN